MFFLLALSTIVVGVITLVVRSKMSLKHLAWAVIIEVRYTIIGIKSCLEDIMTRKHNEMELFPKPGKIALITGGARGIGVEVVKMLLKCDMLVLVGCRDVKKGKSLLEKFRKEGILTGDIEFYELHLDSFKSIREFASNVLKNHNKINVLINNAGVMTAPYVETVDGFESIMAINYLGHFLLTHLLLGALQIAGSSEEKSRIVNVTSVAHELGTVNFEDINNEKHYVCFNAYSQSKLSQLLFSNYLNSLLKTEGMFVRSYAVHPGIVNTEIFRNTYVKNYFSWIINLTFKNIERGAIPIVFAAISPEAEHFDGKYISNCKVHETSNLSKSIDLQEKLFKFTKSVFQVEKFGKVV